MIATGAVSRDLPGLATNGKTVLNSHDAMILDPQPKRLIVIGAGAIGVEFAYFFNAFGTEVTIVEMLPNVLPVEDTEISVTLEKSLTKQGLKIFTSTKLIKADINDQGVASVRSQLVLALLPGNRLTPCTRLHPPASLRVDP